MFEGNNIPKLSFWLVILKTATNQAPGPRCPGCSAPGVHQAAVGPVSPILVSADTGFQEQLGHAMGPDKRCDSGKRPGCRACPLTLEWLGVSKTCII